MGYDVCRDEFNEGIYVFEDTFEYWQNKSFASNHMKSATWGSIVNAFSSDYCGHGEFFGGKYSLSFQGAEQRYAVTSDLDVRSG